MTALRTQFIEYLQAQEMSSRTQTVYVRAVRQLAEYYNLSPDRLTDEQIRQYLGYLKEQKQLAEGTVMQLLCGLKLFYTQMLKRPWNIHVKPVVRRSKTAILPAGTQAAFHRRPATPGPVGAHPASLHARRAPPGGALSEITGADHRGRAAPVFPARQKRETLVPGHHDPVDLRHQALLRADAAAATGPPCTSSARPKRNACP